MPAGGKWGIRRGKGAMAEDELQSLLLRIQREGVEKAQREADEILAKARARAAEIVAEAEARAAAAVKEAERESQLFAERGRKSIEHAGRDVVLLVGEAILRTFERVVAAEVRRALDPAFIADLLSSLAKSYFEHQPGSPDITMLLNPAQVREVTERMLSTGASALRLGLEIKGDRRVVSGFKVAVPNEGVEHDFTEDAIVEALCELLRPDLAKIVRESHAAAAQSAGKQPR